MNNRNYVLKKFNRFRYPKNHYLQKFEVIEIDNII